MRIAVLSDIHANIWALEATLEDVKRRGADVVVNAGDILSGPLEPVATADLLMSLQLPTIAGNHERQLLACAGRPGGPSDQFAFERLADGHLAWLRGLPPTLDLLGTVFVCHGTPSTDLTYLLEEVTPGGARRASRSTVEAHTRGIDRGLILCGHSHLPRTESISGGRVVVNPGSVGLQAYEDGEPHPHVVENGSPHARYALCERARGGWHVSHHSVDYDHRSAAATAQRNGRQDWARWLETGRA